MTDEEKADGMVYAWKEITPSKEAKENESRIKTEDF